MEYVIRICSIYSVVFGVHSVSFFFFFNDTATTEIYTLSLHDALPICRLFLHPIGFCSREFLVQVIEFCRHNVLLVIQTDRKSTRLNSSHGYISYAVFCLKKKKITATVHLPSPQLRPAHLLATPHTTAV